jgi:hypothetical protein
LNNLKQDVAATRIFRAAAFLFIHETALIHIPPVWEIQIAGGIILFFFLAGAGWLRFR